MPKKHEASTGVKSREIEPKGCTWLRAGTFFVMHECKTTTTNL